MACFKAGTLYLRVTYNAKNVSHTQYNMSGEPLLRQVISQKVVLTKIHFISLNLHQFKFTNVFSRNNFDITLLAPISKFRLSTGKLFYGQTKSKNIFCCKKARIKTIPPG